MLQWIQVQKQTSIMFYPGFTAVYYPIFFAGVLPFECYEGAVYVVYNDNTVSRTRFTGATLESGKTQEDLNLKRS